MGSLNGHNQLHVYFFPFMAHGHLIPAVDMAKLFASRGVKTTIVITPLNAAFFSKTIQKHSSSGRAEIQARIIDFPAARAGLPEQCENLDFITSRNLGMEATINFFRASTMLQEPFEKLLEQDRPACVVADMFYPWATESAAKFGIPRLVFHGTSCFAQCVGEALASHAPQQRVESDAEPFVVPGLPDEVRLTKRQLSPSAALVGGTSFLSQLFKRVRESYSEVYGTVFNSFYELEPAYVDHFRKILGRKAWYVGPVSLCNGDVEDKASRGKGAVIDKDECLKWLDSKEANAVVYVCFGSQADFTAQQLREIAVGIESSGQPFIWVVRGRNDVEEDWLPEGFQERTAGRGLIIQGWAPQVLILEHAAIGGFVTHCGWNSTLEGIAAGLPMVTWPMGAEQFYNEKLVTEVVKIGLEVGVEQSSTYGVKMIRSEAVERAVRRIMSKEDEVMAEMRRKVKGLGEAARKAVEAGGSSYADLGALIEELELMS
ncbi:unnamed protein product [Linum tenue]|uniref:Glycosyltransferase n=1 Tax=Linum tenue TaxID=586396 RepID=A0AAV0MHK5_9ROSI|nr:unnamed protein product [Linum tenue]